MKISTDNLLLAGDVGGTKTFLAILAPETGTTANLAEASFENRKFGSLEQMLEEFLAGIDLRVRHMSFSVAGPVLDDEETLISNLGWTVSPARLHRRFGLASVHLVNDLQATAHALPHLSSEDICTLQQGEPRAHGPRAVIAPGTGLGEAFLIWTGTRYDAVASEGGNADFAPADAQQLELLRFLQDRLGHVSYELVCSGVGIPNLYRFLKETGAGSEPAWLAERLAGVVDPTPAIVDAALDPDRPAEICRQALDLFTSILAAEVGNLALRVLPTGGVYLGGGIPPRILPLLRRKQFVERFRSKGKFSDFLDRFPVHVILEPRAALVGAAHYGLSLLERNRATRV
jgi:glucokinase